MEALKLKGIAFSNMLKAKFVSILNRNWVLPAKYKDITTYELWKLAEHRAREVSNGLLLLHNAVFRALHMGMFYKSDAASLRELFQEILCKIERSVGVPLSDSIDSFIESIESGCAYIGDGVAVPFSYNCSCFGSSQKFPQDRTFMVKLSRPIVVHGNIEISYMFFVITSDILRMNIMIAKLIALLRDDTIRALLTRSNISSGFDLHVFMTSILAVERKLDVTVKT